MTKNPPLIQPPSPSGFSRMLVIFAPLRFSVPYLPGGRTAVTVHNAFSCLCSAIVAVMSTSPTPSPYVMQKVSSSACASHHTNVPLLRVLTAVYCSTLLYHVTRSPLVMLFHFFFLNFYIVN